MSIEEHFQLKAKNFRCFGETAYGFDRLYPINVIIGKNNSGKSALLKLISFASGFNPPLSSLSHNKTSPTVYIRNKISQANVERVFSPSTGSGLLPGSNDRDYGIRLIGEYLTVQLQDGNQRSFVSGDNPDFMNGIRESEIQTRGGNLAKELSNPIQGKIFRHLSAERDILNERLTPIDQSSEVLSSSGQGATNLIANFLNDEKLDESKVEVELLQALQEIYGDDADFSRIQTQLDSDSQKYEIFLEERKKGNRIALSDSGSSLKTVLLVLLNLILVPVLDGKAMSNYIFAFEELENNLHPSLQRRLLLYIMKTCRKKECLFFLTTHSNVIIDIFSHQDDAQILHIKHDGSVATVENVKTHIEKCNILDDLDFRASDVLQANGVIWVEGPSDRVYLKKWIELWSGGILMEDVHYQFVFYGGSIRKHLSAADPGEVESAISVFRINRNAVVVMDSDRDASGKKLDESKLKLISELKDSKCSMTFVTKGRDIENYIPPEVVKSRFKLKTVPRAIGQYEAFEDYLDDVASGKGKVFHSSKVLFADKVKDHFQKESLSKMYDLDKRMNDLVKLIKLWNGY